MWTNSSVAPTPGFRRCALKSGLGLWVRGWSSWRHSPLATAQSVADIAEAHRALLRDPQSTVGMFPELDEIARANRARLSDSEAVLARYPDWEAITRNRPTLTPEMADAIRAITSAMPDTMSALPTPQTDERLYTYIFVSRAMATQALVDVMKSVTAYEQVVIVFRGIFPDESLSEAIKDLYTLIHQAHLGEDAPSVILDPRLFQRFGVTQVPEMIHARGERELARVRGSYSVSWFLDEIEQNGRTGDLGVYGTTVPVTEVDLIEEMKKRLAQLDWDTRRDEQVRTYWSRRRFETLPPAPEHRTVRLDPSLWITADIKADDTVIAPAGTRINPLHQIPFTWKLFIFNPQIDEQVAFVVDTLKTLPETQRVQLIASELSRDHGWEQLRLLEQAMGHPVYVLTPAVRQRFGLAYVPTLIDADERYFYRHEYAIETPFTASEEGE